MRVAPPPSERRRSRRRGLEPLVLHVVVVVLEVPPSRRQRQHRRVHVSVLADPVEDVVRLVGCRRLARHVVVSSPVPLACASIAHCVSRAHERPPNAESLGPPVAPDQQYQDR